VKFPSSAGGLNIYITASHIPYYLREAGTGLPRPSGQPWRLTANMPEPPPAESPIDLKTMHCNNGPGPSLGPRPRLGSARLGPRLGPSSWPYAQLGSALGSTLGRRLGPWPNALDSALGSALGCSPRLDSRLIPRLDSRLGFRLDSRLGCWP
jgi:hypothetical protein